MLPFAVDIYPLGMLSPLSQRYIYCSSLITAFVYVARAICLCCVVGPHRPYYIRRFRLLLPTEYIGLSVTLVSPTKTAEPIEMPFGLRTRVGKGNHVLDVFDPSMGRDDFFGGGGKGIPL